MSVELISVLVAVLAIGATLAGLILTSNRGLRQDMARLESRLDGRIGGLEERLREDMGKMESAAARGHQAVARRHQATRGARGADGAWPSQARRVAGRVARGHHRTGLGQLTRSWASQPGSRGPAPLPSSTRWQPGVGGTTGHSGCSPGPRTIGAGIRFGEPRLFGYFGD